MRVTAIIPGRMIATTSMTGLSRDIMPGMSRSSRRGPLGINDHGPADWCGEDLAARIGTPCAARLTRPGNGNSNSTGIARSPGKIKVAKVTSGGMLDLAGEDNPVLAAKRKIAA
jgi:hypothetical protein